MKKLAATFLSNPAGSMLVDKKMDENGRVFEVIRDGEAVIQKSDYIEYFFSDEKTFFEYIKWRNKYHPNFETNYSQGIILENKEDSSGFDWDYYSLNAIKRKTVEPINIFRVIGDILRESLEEYKQIKAEESKSLHYKAPFDLPQYWIKKGEILYQTLGKGKDQFNFNGKQVELPHQWVERYWENTVPNGIVVEYHREGNGHKALEYYIKDGKIEGEYKEWYVNGELRLECTYKNGLLDGEYKEYSLFGTPSEVIIKKIYKNGKVVKL